MSPKQILKALADGKVVTYTVRRLRGYLHGDASFVLQPADVTIGVSNIGHKLKCFRFDEKPYDNPRWQVSESA